MDIRIEGDPTSCTLAAPIDPRQAAVSGGPVVLEVSEPLGQGAGCCCHPGQRAALRPSSWRLTC